MSRSPTERMHEASNGRQRARPFGERFEQGIYLFEAIVLGGPTLAIGLLSVMMFALAAVALGSVEPSPVIAMPILMVSAIAAGLSAWFVLSGHFLTGGRAALRAVSGFWWLGLAAGLAVSGCMSWSLGLLDDLVSGKAGWLALFGSGLPMWISSLHLIALRLRK